MIDIQRAIQKFLEETSRYDLADDNVKRKELHSFRVMEQAKRLAETMKLNQEDIELATLIGLLHDIGRFEQYARYKTYSDAQTFNHGDFGAEYLMENNRIREYIQDSQYDNIIYEAIKNHSKNNIREDLSERQNLHAKIIRDADKLDIFYEGVDIFWKEDIEEINKSIANPNVLEAIQQEIPVPRTNPYVFKSINAVIGLMALVFNLNYLESFNIVKQEQYIDKIAQRFQPEDEKTKEILEIARTKINQFIEKRATHN